MSKEMISGGAVSLQGTPAGLGSGPVPFRCAAETIGRFVDRLVLIVPDDDICCRP